MSSDWPTYTVKEIAADKPNALSTGPFGSSISSKFFQDQGVPVIRGGNLSIDIDCRLSDDNLVFVSHEKAKEFTRSIAVKGDLIFTCWGTINQVGFLDGSSKFSEYVISNKQMKFTPDPDKADSQYLYYVFSSPSKQAEIINNGIGAAVPGFNLGQLKEHIVMLPRIEIQKKIATILGSLDDKIKINCKTNQTLEQMAQAIFKSWFVDFEPVKAKIDAKIKGRDPERAAMCTISGKTNAELDQLPAEERQRLSATAALFPDELVETDLGIVPKGWGERRLDDILELSYGKSLTKTDRKEGNFPVYGSGGVTGYHSNPLVAGPGIIIGRKGTVGSLYWEDRDFFPIDTAFYVEPKNGATLEFLFYLLQTLGLERMNTDAAVPGLNRNNVYRIQVPSYPVSVIQDFSKTIRLLRKKISAALDENATLTTIRDNLLPRLLSGEIPINTAS